MSRRNGSGLVVAGAVLLGCGARSTLTPSEQPDSASGAAGSSGACPVRARPRLNAVGSPTSTPRPVLCHGPPVSLAEPCPGKCGNGAIDDCALTDHAVEACDGVQLGGVTCDALGFSGGVLACDATCRFDPRGCSDCAPNDHVTVCSHANLGGSVFAALSVATRADRIAVAGYSTTPDQFTLGLGVALFGADFAPLGAPACIDFDSPLKVALAPTSNGFVLASSNGAELDTFELSVDGAPQTSTRIVDARNPVLIAAPDSGPLLLYYDLTLWSAALLDASGAPIWSVPVFGAAGEPEVGDEEVNGVYADGGFLVSSGGDYVERVEMDGTVSCLHRVADGARSTKIDWNASVGSAVWASTDGSDSVLQWARIDRDGARVSAPIEIARGESSPLSRVSMADGATLVVSRGPMLEPSASTAYLPLFAYRLDATWIDRNAAVREPPAPLVTNGYGSSTPQVVRFQNILVAAWLGQAVLPRDQGPAWLTLARIEP